MRQRTQKQPQVKKELLPSAKLCKATVHKLTNHANVSKALPFFVPLSRRLREMMGFGNKDGHQ